MGPYPDIEKNFTLDFASIEVGSIDLPLIVEYQQNLR
jgi:hypothetical protein